MARTVPWVAAVGLARDAGGDLVGAVPRARHGATTSVTSPMRSAVVGRHPLVVARQRDAQRLAQADAAHQADRFERRHHAVGDVRVEERRVVGADDDVGFVDEVERARGADALHRAHDRLPHLLPLRAQQLARVLVVPDVVGLAVALLGVEAGAERAVARGPRSTTALTARVVLDDGATRRGLSSHICRSNAFSTSGRFSVMVATRSSASTSS